ncbi:MAG: hypothetical protein QOG09_613, partial [Solirubrobacterales bacterium]|nr:hypothetical protein [Solirubrobacterales bacterium]
MSESQSIATGCGESDRAGKAAVSMQQTAGGDQYELGIARSSIGVHPEFACRHAGTLKGDSLGIP